jgi:hypothetical protein
MLALVKRFWESGSRRTAWTTLSNALSSSDGLDSNLRATATADLVDMMLEDEAATSAIQHLKPLFDEVDHGITFESGLVYRIRFLWARSLVEVYSYPDAEKALITLLSEQRDSARRMESLALLAELYLLHGDLARLENMVEA